MSAKIPTDVLLVRALNHFERAQLDLEAGLSPEYVVQWIDKGIELVMEVLES